MAEKETPKFPPSFPKVPVVLPPEMAPPPGVPPTPVAQVVNIEDVDADSNKEKDQDV